MMSVSIHYLVTTKLFTKLCYAVESSFESQHYSKIFLSNIVSASVFLSPGKQSVSLEEPACVFCFFSLPTVGYLYSLKGGVELLSAYQYPEKVLEAVLTDHLLHVITKYVCRLICYENHFIFFESPLSIRTLDMTNPHIILTLFKKKKATVLTNHLTNI